MKKVNVFLLVIIVAIVISFLTIFMIERSKIIKVEKYVMDVKVTDDGIMGFNVDPDGFHFGSLGNGQGARRELYIHDVEEDILVTITKKGEMASWVNNPNNFIVKKGEAKNISLSVSVPEGAALGNYSGEVTVVLRKA